MGNLSSDTTTPCAASTLCRSAVRCIAWSTASKSERTFHVFGPVSCASPMCSSTASRAAMCCRRLRRNGALTLTGRTGRHYEM